MAYPYELGAVNTAAFSMDYFRFGRGEDVLVILPGLSPKPVTLFAPVVAQSYAALAERFTVYVFDRRENLPAVYPIAAMAEDTAAALAELGLRDVCLFGASQGGMIAQVVALRYPELVRKLILGSSASRVEEAQYRLLARWAELARRGDRAGLYLDFGEKIYSPADFAQFRDALLSIAKTLSDEELRRFVILVEGTRDFDVSAELRQLRCPVLLLGAQDDAVLGPQAAQEIARQLEGRPNFSMHLYDGFGHAAFDTAPDYRERMLDFLVD